MKKQGNSKQNLVNQNDFQHRNLYPSSLREYAKEIDDCANSPSAWIYKGGKTLQDLCRPFMGGTAIKSANKSDASVASWRKMAAQTILSSENLNSDDENDRGMEGARVPELEGAHHQPHPMYRSDSTKDGSIAMTLKSLSCAGNLSVVPDEPRIVAPNVSKLSPRSVVEIRLQSINECVAILCSVDVLKMRSSFFYEVLNEQEDDRNYSSRDQNEIWRNPLVIPEISPFEAAAFLESLHEGRAVFKGEWVYCWARLSVAWQIQDLVLEYAAQIDHHIGNLISIVKTKNWRTNPNVLVGARVAVFRKGPTLMPTVLTGIVIDAVQTTGYSKVRVHFDSTDTRTTSIPHKGGSNGLLGVNTVGSSSPHTPVHSPTGIAHHHCSNSNSPYVPFTPRLLSTQRPYNVPSSTLNMGNRGMGLIPTGAMIGDVGEPIWVQLSHPHGNPTDQVPGSNTPGTPNSEVFTAKSDGYKDIAAPAYSSWSDPDELSMTEIKKFISLGDKKTFWEMSRAIIELPEISEHCKSGVRTSKDLIFLLKNPEFKVLWTAEAADILPKQAAADLVTAAYVPTLDVRNRNF